MSKYYSLIAAIAVAVGTAVTPAVQTALAAHPTVTAAVAGAIAVIMHWLPSPGDTPNA